MKNWLTTRQKLPSRLAFDTGSTQAVESVLVELALPRQKLIDRQVVPAKGVFKGNEAAANPGDDFCLASDDPAFGISGW